jgi:hypothetical protein
MLALELKDKTLHIKLKWWERFFWPTKKLEIPLTNIENITIENKMPRSILCKKPVANIPGIICIGIFYPKGLLKKGQLWCFTRKNKYFVSFTLHQYDYEKIVLGISQQESDKWSGKIKESLREENGNSSNNRR